MDIRMAGMWFVTMLVVQGFSIWHEASGMVTSIPLPMSLNDCLDQKTDNSSTVPPRFIQSLCISKFVDTTAAWAPNMSDPNVKNYITSLLRKVVREAELLDSPRHKRQVFGAPVRREIRAAPYQMNFRRYAIAVRRLKNQFTVRRDTNNYDVIAGIHSGRTLRPAHNGPNFLGWHRIYLLIMEQALGTTIPYWDSSLDFEMADPVNTILFTARYFGNGFGFVTSGPFANLPGVPIIRNIGSDGTLISKQAIAAVLSRTRHAQIVEPSTATTVEFSLEAHHNGPHVWVDGTLASLASAAYDPVFFCHHAFIDYIWELFRRRLPNAQSDYPPTNVPGHQPFRFMDFGDFPYAPRIRNAEGYMNRYARLRVYQPAPTCPRCANSPDLTCNQGRRVCVSRPAPPQARMQTPSARVLGGATGRAGAGAALAAAAAPGTIEADTPNRALNAVRQAGPLATGPKFVSPFRDGRTRGGSLPVAAADPSLARGKRSIGKEDVNTDFSQHKPELPYQNTFWINGQSDISLWAFIPVKVLYMNAHFADTEFSSIHTKYSNSTTEIDSSDPLLLETTTAGSKKISSIVYRRCLKLKNGPDKVYVESDGINYSGRYKDFARIDPVQPVSTSFTYVGIKKPSNDSAIEAMISAYDTCGRVCRARCLVRGSQPPLYKSCAGSIMADTRLPFMYKRTYDAALRGLWNIWESAVRGSQLNGQIIPLLFVCDFETSLPWYKTVPLSH